MRIAYTIAVFLLTVFLGDRLLSFAAKTVVRHSQNQFARMYEGKARADILFLGDSRVDRNISYDMVRHLTRKSCLNLGLGGNNVLVSEALLKDYVQRYGKPDMVVVELGLTETDPATMGEMRIFSYCSPNMDALARSSDPIFSAFETVFSCLRFNDPAFWRLAAEVVRPPSERLLQNKIPEVLVNEAKRESGISRKIYRENLESLGRICDLADARGFELRLLISPCWNDFKRAITNFDDWKAALQKAAGKRAIRDYSDVFVAHPEYFNDVLHLNATGAERWVQKLRVDGVL